MKYDLNDKRAIKTLHEAGRALFEVIEGEEKGEIVNIPGLCKVLNMKPTFFVFSCLRGDAKREELSCDLGVLFTTRVSKELEEFRVRLSGAGLQNQLLVIIDDTEPVKFWGWNRTQQDITDWCTMVIEDTKIPTGWNVRLWSEIENSCKNTTTVTLPTFEEFAQSMQEKVLHSVVYPKLFAHIERFPNQGLKDLSTKRATVHKLVQYAFQSLVLNHALPSAVLIQTETPWEVKDALFRGPLGNACESIIHPFERRR